MSKRYINGRMVEVRDTNTEAVVETIRPEPRPRAPKEAIHRLRVIQARLEALSDTNPEHRYGESSPESTERLGRPYKTNISPEARQEVSPFVTTWLLAELEQILPWLEGGERPMWWNLTP